MYLRADHAVPALRRIRKSRRQAGARVQGRRRPLSVERLEERELLAVDFVYDDGYRSHWVGFFQYYDYFPDLVGVHIYGTPYNDRVQAKFDKGMLEILVANPEQPDQYNFFRIDGDLVPNLFFHGFEGNDRFNNYTAIETHAWGGPGDDYLNGGIGRAFLYGESGNDELTAGPLAFADMWGGDGDDKLNGTDQPNLLYGGSGKDEIYARGGDDVVWGEDGDDYISGGPGDDFLAGQLGNDTIYGDSGNDTLWGGPNTQEAAGWLDSDYLYGGEGLDFLYGGAQSDYLDGGVLGKPDGFRDYLQGEHGPDRFARPMISFRGALTSEDDLADFSTADRDTYYESVGDNFIRDFNSVKVVPRIGSSTNGVQGFAGGSASGEMDAEFQAAQAAGRAFAVTALTAEEGARVGRLAENYFSPDGLPTEQPADLNLTPQALYAQYSVPGAVLPGDDETPPPEDSPAVEPQSTPLPDELVGQETNARLVEKLYLQVLGRAPETGGWVYWVRRLTDGTADLGTVAAGIFESNERIDPILRGYYRDYLLREVDEGGLTFWRDVWRNTGGPEPVVAGIISSPEFFESAGGTNEAWVSALYQRLLGRAADAGGLDYWTQKLNQLESPWSRQSVVAGFTNSRENRRNLIQGWYSQYLDRAATEVEIQAFVEQMQNGASQRDIQMQLIKSDEYRAVI